MSFLVSLFPKRKWAITDPHNFFPISHIPWDRRERTPEAEDITSIYHGILFVVSNLSYGIVVLFFGSSSMVGRSRRCQICPEPTASAKLLFISTTTSDEKSRSSVSTTTRRLLIWTGSARAASSVRGMGSSSIIRWGSVLRSSVQFIHGESGNEQTLFVKRFVIFGGHLSVAFHTAELGFPLFNFRLECAVRNQISGPQWLPREGMAVIAFQPFQYCDSLKGLSGSRHQGANHNL